MRVNKLLAVLLCFVMVFSSFGISVFAEELPEKGCSVIIYNEDGSVGMEIDGTNSASPFKLSSQLEDAYAFINNAFLFGITGTPSIYIEMYEDSNDDAVAQIKYNTVIETNGFVLSDYEIADDAVDDVTVTVDGVDVTPEPPVLVWDGVSYSLDWLSTGNPEGTAGDKFYLNSVNDLAGFAYYVNNYSSTNNIFTGDTVYLNVDVDLAGYDWAPIGTAYPREKNRFYGSFDGQGHTISNLKVEEGHYFAGLFGQIPTYNYTQKFSNITIENAVVVAANETESGKSKEAAGALIGRANGSIIENCHLTGEIEISGDRFVGGIVGHSYAQISDCSVEAFGTISADTWQVGGLVGSHGATDTYTSSINDCSVIGDDSNGGITITTKYAPAGGFAGVITLSKVDETTFDNITVENISISANSKEYGGDVAEIASGYEATNSTVANVVASMNVAKIGDVYYKTLKEAIYDATAGDTIYLLNEINEGSIKLPATLSDVTIDGQGTAVVKNTVINAHDGSSLNYQGLAVKNTIFDNSRFVLTGRRTGQVIFKDISFEGNTLKNIVATGNMAAVHMNMSATESIENFTFKNNVIDGVSGSTNSGVVLQQLDGNAVFEGNVIKNVVWNAVQIATAKPTLKLVVKDNEFQSNGSSVLNIAAAPSVILENNIVTPAEGKVGVWYPAEAKIGDVLYATLQGAVDAAEEGATIVLVSDIEAEVNPTADSTSNDDNCLIHTDKDDVITLDLNGKTISVKGHDEAKYDTLAIRNNGNLTIVDNGTARSAGTITLAYDGTQEVGTSQIHSTILNFGTLTINGGNIQNTATSGKARYAIYNYSWGGNADVTINGGSIDSNSTLALYTSAYDDFSRNTCNVTINGGEIDGVWYSNTGATASASLTINGGDFDGDYNGAAVTIKEPAAGNTTLAVTGGNFVKSGNDSIVYSSNDASVASFISGGTFSSNVSA